MLLSFKKISLGVIRTFGGIPFIAVNSLDSGIPEYRHTGKHGQFLMDNVHYRAIIFFRYEDIASHRVKWYIPAGPLMVHMV